MFNGVILKRSSIISHSFLKSGVINKNLTANYKHYKQLTNFANYSFNDKRLFHSSRVSNAYDLEKEFKCREILDSLPSTEFVFNNEDGSPRKPSDEELRKIAFLTTYVKERELTLWETLFSFPKKYANLYEANSSDLHELQASCRLIIDKIPYEDTATGEIKWQIVRDGDELQGWETIMHFLFVPTMLYLLFLFVFTDDLDVYEWARRELVYRVKERAIDENDTNVVQEIDKFGKPDGDFTLDDFSNQDAFLIEKIIQGDYDRLAGLKINQTELEKRRLGVDL